MGSNSPPSVMHIVAHNDSFTHATLSTHCPSQRMMGFSVSGVIVQSGLYRGTLRHGGLTPKITFYPLGPSPRVCVGHLFSLKVEGVFRICVFSHEFSDCCYIWSSGVMMLVRKRNVGLFAIDIERRIGGVVSRKWKVGTGSLNWKGGASGVLVICHYGCTIHAVLVLF